MIPRNMILEELKDKLINIKSRGWIKTERSGDTGIGFTLERLLGLRSSSRSTPHYKKEISIKSRREGSSKRITLFAKVPVWGSLGRQGLLNKHGYYDKNKRWSLYTSIYGNRKSIRDWKLSIDEKNIYVLRNEEPIVYWKKNTLKKILITKLSSTLFVVAKSRGKKQNEMFFYDKAYFASEPNIENFEKLIKDGTICLDFAMHKEKNKVIDKGFLFRIQSSKIYKLYANYKQVM